MIRKGKLSMLLCGILTMSLLVGCGSSSDSNSDNVKNIGVLQLIQHSALDTANEGFVDALKEAGYEDGKNIKIEQQNAQGKIDTAQQIANQFVSSKKDLIFAIATPSAQAAYNATKDIPIVFTAVTDPVADSLVKSLESSGNNLTGTSDMADIEEQLELYTKVLPEMKTLGIIYTTSETNSVNQVKLLNELAPKFGLKVKEIGVANINEINQNLTSAIKDIDALYAPTDNNVAASYELVAQIALSNNVPVLGAEPAVVEVGGLICKGIDYYELGKMAGDKAVQILEGKKPSEIPSETMPELAITVNTDVAEKLGIVISDDILKDANKVTGGVK